MKEKLFAELVASVKEGGQILRDEKQITQTRVFTHNGWVGKFIKTYGTKGRKNV